jgi:hypothetical protein
VDPHPITSKPCIKCGETKPLDQFHRHSQMRSGCINKCKSCISAYGREWRSRPGIRDRQTEHSYTYTLLTKYGITRQEYDDMLAAQGGGCAICGGLTRRRPNVDHCHKTGKVRAILCHLCNQGLGSFRDNPDLLRKAIAYLEIHS